MSTAGETTGSAPQRRATVTTASIMGRGLWSGSASGSTSRTRSPGLRRARRDAEVQPMASPCQGPRGRDPRRTGRGPGSRVAGRRRTDVVIPPVAVNGPVGGQLPGRRRLVIVDVGHRHDRERWRRHRWSSGRPRVMRSGAMAAAATRGRFDVTVPAPTPMATRRSSPVATHGQVVAQGPSQALAEGAGDDTIGSVAEYHRHARARPACTPGRRGGCSVPCAAARDATAGRCARAARLLAAAGCTSTQAMTLYPEPATQVRRSATPVDEEARWPFESLSPARRSWCGQGGDVGRGRRGVWTPPRLPLS